MANFSKTSVMNPNVPDYAITSKTSDGGGSSKENRWSNTNASRYYGFYYGIGEFRTAINAFATWVIGQGYICDMNRDQIRLSLVDGWGEDTFLSILFNMLCTKKFNGDAYAEIITHNGKPITEGGEFINLKPLDPRRMTHITNNKGRLIGYEYDNGDKSSQPFKPSEIFHLCNDRIIDEPHGTAVTSAVEWVIEKIQQAREDFAEMMHVSTVRIFYVDEQDATRQAILESKYADAIKNKRVLILTCKPEDASFQDLTVPSSQGWIMWLDHLEDRFYKALGVPKVVLGGTSENTEASAKVGVISYEPIWTREIMELQADIYNQLRIRLYINKQPSLMDNMQSDESKNTGQTKLQYQGTQ